MPPFANAHHFVIQNSSFYDQAGKPAFEALQESIAPGAFHNSSERFNAPKCHPSTRQAVQRRIISWVDDINRTEGVIWLNGLAGVGKSAIAQTLAEDCHRRKRLAASFFFSRTAARRTDATYLFPTIAYQLALSIPSARPYIEDAIEVEPSIFSLSLETQMDVLIIRPLQSAESTQDHTGTTADLIIIDGLDECHNPETQSHILELISSALLRYHLPICFLICSRPETEIRNIFYHTELHQTSITITLDDNFSPDHDIEIFLRSKFSEMKQRHTLKSVIPKSWPSNSDIQALVTRASGQFIYAATVIKYITDSRHHPIERLSVVLGISLQNNHMPYVQLDQLYRYILSTIQDPGALRILGILVAPSLTSSSSKDNPRSRNEPDSGVADMHTIITKSTQKRLHTLALHPWSTQFLDKLLTFRPGMVYMLLTDLHSVLSLPADASSSVPINIPHASFSEFLLDRSRSQTFFVDLGLVYADLAACCLRQCTTSSELKQVSLSRTIYNTLPNYGMRLGKSSLFSVQEKRTAEEKPVKNGSLQAM
ncbi:hypothetical protein BDQ12DRAFT_725281 [Crucibulum laeve]|uniref:NACHT domain-containing protein n=1 Tax=Crucibulum laeve TaxID=68775 RepID=A0A5C3M537_9AGAR|nr:hypothetical protein BDQ12DRAFT_725281 [Crucibulum laeve]